jgi:trimethylamine--corrinoid protein Co-methyltransferase
MARDRGRKRRARGGGLKQLSQRAIVNPYDPIEVLDEERIERIHEASLEVLETIGMEITSPSARDILAAAGADVDRASHRVRFDRGLVLEYIAHAPAEFTIHARNPANNVTFGGNRIVFTPVSSAPNCSDEDRGRRAGTYRDFANFLRLAQSLNILQLIGGYPVEPLDLPVPTRHLDCYYGFITLTDMAWRTYALSTQRCIDGIAMNCIARRITREELARRPGLFTMINTNSPLLLDGAMADGIIEMAGPARRSPSPPSPWPEPWRRSPWPAP